MKTSRFLFLLSFLIVAGLSTAWIGVSSDIIFLAIFGWVLTCASTGGMIGTVTILVVAGDKYS